MLLLLLSNNKKIDYNTRFLFNKFTLIYNYLRVSEFDRIKHFTNIKYLEALWCQTQYLQHLQIVGNTTVFAHLCFVRVCIVRLIVFRLEAKVKGHYLQPERAASASSFSPS